MLQPEQPCLQAAGISLHFNYIHSIPTQSCSGITTSDAEPNLPTQKRGTPERGTTDAPACRVWYSLGLGCLCPQLPRDLLVHIAQDSANETQHQQQMCLPRASLGLLWLLDEGKRLSRGTYLKQVNRGPKVLVSLLEKRRSERSAPGTFGISKKEASSGISHLLSEAQLVKSSKPW